MNILRQIEVVITDGVFTFIVVDLQVSVIKQWEQLSVVNSYTRAGFPGFAFKTSRAEIDRLVRRISQLEAQSANKTKEMVINGVRLVENVEVNRVQLIFDCIPSEEARKKLKGNGFR